MRLGFTTDIHLDHIKYTKDHAKQYRVGVELTRDLDVLTIAGDISVGTLLEGHLRAFLKGASCPVYFVLGNHDFWLAPEETIWGIAKSFPGSLDHLDVVELTPNTALVGVSGWYDTRAGNIHSPGVIMNEFRAMPRFMNLGPMAIGRKIFWAPELLHEVHRQCKDMADDQTRKFIPKLEEAAKKYSKVFIATHIPPWVEACWSPSPKGLSRDVSPEWLPWSVNVELGLQIESLAEEYPRVQFQVLSGHTHGEGESEVAANIKAYSGEARYKQPKLAKIFEI